MNLRNTAIALLFMCGLGLFNQLKAQLDTNDFVSTWKTDNLGSTNDSAVTIYTDPNYTYNYDIDWDNDGIFDTTGLSASYTIQYPQAGTYTIRIKGNFPSLRFHNTIDRFKLISVDQWGDQNWMSLDSAFYGCENLVSVGSDAPILDSIESIRWMFHSTYKFNSPINHWDVSLINDMTAMFTFSSFNQPLDSWDVSSVTKMDALFLFTSDFNQPLNNWDVSNVTSMGNMFNEARAFDQDLSAWNTSNVIRMNYMFYNAYSFNQDIGTWNTAHVQNMQRMFYNAIKFDQNLGAWTIDSVTNMDFMLAGSNLSIENYDSTLIAWEAKPHPANIFLNSSRGYCASQAARDSLAADGWFLFGDNLNCNYGDFVTYWQSDFPGTSNDSAVTIFTDPNYNYNYDVDWDNDGIFDTLGLTGNITIQYSTRGNKAIRIKGDFPSIKFGQGDRQKLLSITQWGRIPFRDLENAFDSCVNLANVDNQYAPILDSTNSLNYMFRGAGNFGVPFGRSWDVSNIQSMDGMFEGSNLTAVQAGYWNVSNVTNMKSMFKGFQNFSGIGNYEDLSSWDVSNVTDMSNMFSETSFFNSPIGSWDVSAVSNMSNMFKGAISFDQGLDQWDVSNVTDMSGMFSNATSFNQNLNNWDVSNLTDMSEMFSGAQGFNQNLGMWYIDSVSSMIGVLDSSGMSVNNYDSTLIGWQGKSNPDSLTLGANGLAYCLGEAARDSLIADGWIFNGDAKDSACIVTSINGSLEGTVHLFKIYPNPTQGMLFIEIDQADQNTPLLIYNQVGQMVLETRIVEGKNQLDLSDLPKGLYILQFKQEQHKIILQ